MENGQTRRCGQAAGEVWLGYQQRWKKVHSVIRVVGSTERFMEIGLKEAWEMVWPRSRGTQHLRITLMTTCRVALEVSNRPCMRIKGSVQGGIFHVRGGHIFETPPLRESFFSFFFSPSTNRYLLVSGVLFFLF